MIMQNSYKEDMIEQLMSIKKETLPKDTARGFDPGQILKDTGLTDALWTSYQKLVEEYDVDPDYAIRETLQDCLHKPFHSII